MINEYFQRGATAAQAGDFQSAIELFSQAITLNPLSSIGYCNLAKVYFEMHQWGAARLNFQQVLTLDQRNFDAHFFLGLVEMADARSDFAIAHFEAAKALRPNDHATLYQLGLVHYAEHRHTVAMDYFEKLLQENQNDISVLNALGNTQQANGNFLSALENYNKAIAINANIAHIHFNRGITLQSLEKHRDATISYLQATNLKPNYTMAYFNCGVALEKLGEIDQALVFFDKVLQLDARSSRAYFHKACIYAQQADYEQAELLYQQAITYNSDEFDARWNLSLLLLRRGDFCQGWRGYEARLQLGSSNSKPPPSTRQSLPWLGDAKNLATKTIILWHEQGMGDTLQFCRYASLVADLGGSVQLLVPSSLVTLLQNMDKRIAVKASDSSLAVDVHADLHCPLMSLPLVCGTDSTYKIPNRVPYVVCDASLSHIWNEKLKERLGATRKRRVGLVWASGYRPDRPDLMSFTKLRDLPLAKFFALAHPNVDFISLQKGEHAEQELTSLIQQGWTGPAIENYGNELIDFSDTAALIDNLDLVISVDTSVAHLAGAMGKPVWILNCFDACWRWLYGQDPKRTDSPWYPSARLFRQSKVGDWDSVIDKVREALTDFAAQSLN